MKVSVAVVQFQPELNQPLENISRLEPLIKVAGDCDLIILPELSNSGYNFENYLEAYDSSEKIGGKGTFQDFLISCASRYKSHIVSGINERTRIGLFNTAVLAGPEGIIGSYRKIHLFMHEKEIFQKGNTKPQVYDLGGFRIGIQICFDYLFPENWRNLAEKGADLICHPSNLLTENAQRCVPGLSLMNRVYIATANRIGTERGLLFNGTSLFTDPKGIIIQKASSDKTEVLKFEIDTEISRNKMMNPINHVFNDRRPDLYQP